MGFSDIEATTSPFKIAPTDSSLLSHDYNFILKVFPKDFSISSSYIEDFLGHQIVKFELI